MGGLGAVVGGSWVVLGRLGALLGGSWGLLGRLGALLGGSWRPLGRSKIDQKINRKIDPKSSRIATEKKRSGATPVVVSELDKPHRNLDATSQKNYQNHYRYD